MTLAKITVAEGLGIALHVFAMELGVNYLGVPLTAKEVYTLLAPSM